MNSKEAFTEVYERYAASIIKSVVAQTKDIELANEICQNVFMSYYRHMHKVEPEFVKAWLFHAMDNQLIDYWRKASTRRESLEEEGSEIIASAKDRCNVEKQCSDRRFICEIMEKLKEKNRNWYDVIVCICVRQMTQEEASSYLGISEEDLRSRLYRARKFLREIFDEER